jgi:F0F1-type ATP synthase assembly protein I
MLDDSAGDDDLDGGGVVPGPPAGSDQPPPMQEVDAYAVISYLLSGVIIYGGLGWLLDWWLGTRGFVAAGIVVGAAAGVWLVWLRYSRA